MEFNKELSKPMRELTYLEINSQDKKRLLKYSYGCLAKLAGFPEELEKSINFAKSKNMEGDEAYFFIKESLQAHDKDICKKISTANLDSSEINGF